jgi:hypothetical protein
LHKGTEEKRRKEGKTINLASKMSCVLQLKTKYHLSIHGR